MRVVGAVIVALGVAACGSDAKSGGPGGSGGSGAAGSAGTGASAGSSGTSGAAGSSGSGGTAGDAASDAPADVPMEAPQTGCARYLCPALLASGCPDLPRSQEECAAGCGMIIVGPCGQALLAVETCIGDTQITLDCSSGSPVASMCGNELQALLACLEENP